MGTFCVVVSPPLFDQNLSFAQAVEDFTVEQLIPEPPLELSQYLFSQGLPGSMQAVLAPTAAIQSLAAWATNSGPLSERMKRGAPRRMNRSVRASITSTEFSFRFTVIAALPAVLIKDVQRPEGFAIIGSAVNKVIGLHVVAMLRSKPDT